MNARNIVALAVLVTGLAVAPVVHTEGSANATPGRILVPGFKNGPPVGSGGMAIHDPSCVPPKDRKTVGKTHKKYVAPVRCSSRGSQTTGNIYSADPTSKGQALSHGACKGIGSRQLMYAPLAPSDISVIEPMGNMIGAHVTPIDHEYYLQANQHAPRNTYAVHVPADGTIVEIQHRTEYVGIVAPTGGAADEYRVVISYSCTFFSYVDLMTSLDPVIKKAVPKGTAAGSYNVFLAVPVKANQVIGRVGDQSLDFAVWDTSKPLKGFSVPLAYNNAEPWKIDSVRPLDYFSPTVKAILMPFYARKVQPIDGKIDYDIDGTASGNWFVAGTNGYMGWNKPYSSPTYFNTHLALAYDALDGKSLVFSIGNFGTFNNSTPSQYAISGTAADWASVTPSTGLVSYQLINLVHDDQTGQQWMGLNVPQTITVDQNQPVVGTALIQLTGPRTLKLEIFAGQTASQVTGFDSNAELYNRGQDSTKNTIVPPLH